MDFNNMLNMFESLFDVPLKSFGQKYFRQSLNIFQPNHTPKKNLMPNI